jgi:hypothetical protein
MSSTAQGPPTIGQRLAHIKTTPERLCRPAPPAVFLDRDRRPRVLAGHVRRPLFHGLILCSALSWGEVLVHFSLSLSPSLLYSPSRHTLLFASPCRLPPLLSPTCTRPSPSHRAPVTELCYRPTLPQALPHRIASALPFPSAAVTTLMVAASGKELAAKPPPRADLQAGAGDLSSGLAPPSASVWAAPVWSASPVSSQSRFFPQMGHVSHPSALAATSPTVTGFGRSHHRRGHEVFPSPASLMGWQPSPVRAGQKWSVSQ